MTWIVSIHIADSNLRRSCFLDLFNPFCELLKVENCAGEKNFRVLDIAPQQSKELQKYRLERYQLFLSEDHALEQDMSVSVEIQEGLIVQLEKLQERATFKC